MGAFLRAACVILTAAMCSVRLDAVSDVVSSDSFLHAVGATNALCEGILLVLPISCLSHSPLCKLCLTRDFQLLVSNGLFLSRSSVRMLPGVRYHFFFVGTFPVFLS